MGINFDDSLSRMRARRLGYDREVSFASAITEATKSERYEARASSRATRYTLGAMAAVDPSYTEICNREADRVVEQLKSGLAAYGQRAEYRKQGSVPLNTHIRGASDVDQLVIYGGALTYEREGALARAGLYLPYSGSLISDVIGLRRDCADILERRFPQATINDSGNKAIRISGGSLLREIDVVPSHWTDTVNYQSSLSEVERGVCILDKSVPKLMENLPFLHIDEVHRRDATHAGGVKMSIRLLKNIRTDTDTAIDLSSYDIAGLMWNAPTGWLIYQPQRELSILLATERWLTALSSDYSAASGLMTPDRSRRVIDNAEKFTSLVRLSVEVSALVEEVANEWVPVVKSALPPGTSRAVILDRVEIPA